MVIDKKILDELTAKENPRLRCNDMVPGGVVLNIEKGQWHSLKCRIKHLAILLTRLCPSEKATLIINR